MKINDDIINQINHNSSDAFLRNLFDDVLNNQFNQEQIIAILLNLNKIGINKAMVKAAISSLLDKMVKINLIPEVIDKVIDLCGTGGDRLNSLNISTAVSFVVAACGVKVAKNGNRASSSNSGSADIFQHLNISFIQDERLIYQSLEQNNLVFLFAPFFHPILKNIADIRSKIASQYHQPTIFNFLGPLLNPLRVKKQIIGVGNKEMMPIIANAVIDLDILTNCQELEFSKREIYFVCGDDKMDEITITANSTIIHLKNNKINYLPTFNPQYFGFKKANIEDIRGRNPEYNSKQLVNLLNGAKNSYRDIVIINAALALLLANNNINQNDDLEDKQENNDIDNNFNDNIAKYITKAKDAIDSGKALSILHKMQDFSLKN
jgi:anthranilate phosphoribosyltransferase